MSMFRLSGAPFSLTICAAALLLASCGGGGGGGDASGTAATSSSASSDTTTTGSTASTASASGGSTTYVDAGRLPSAKPGVSDRRISSTGEMPYRDPDGMGAFRTVCDYSHMNFDDPLVYPGRVNAAHLHVFFGNTGTNANSTPDSIRTTGGSTCRGGIVNRTAYWVPAMIDTSTGAPIQPRSDVDVYYKTGYLLGMALNGSVQPFPVGFRMIGGDSKSRVPQARMYYSCHSDDRDSPTIPSCPGGELWQIVEFPQCWDGVNLDSPDHRSHVVYPATLGRCPSTHPVMLPQVSYHVKYDVPAGGAGNWRLSSDIAGTPAGSSGHGDWVNGWEQEVMDTFVHRVINLGLSGGSHMVGDGRIIYY